MADNQTLAAVQEVLLNARIRFTTGTEAQWTAADPVLLDGEIGLVKGTKPVKFKVGDGVKKWSALGWGQPIALMQLADDATHRLVTDTEKAAWNAKAPKSHAAADPTYGAGTYENYGHVKLMDVVSESLDVASGIAATPKAVFIAMDEAQAAKTAAEEAKTALANKVDKVTGKGLSTNDYTTAEKTKLSGVAAGANNYTHPASHPATMITEDASHRFATDAEKTKWNLEYTIEKAATESGFASTYYLKKGGAKVGASINIPLDQVLKSSSIKSVTAAGKPYTGAAVGDKYIEFVFQNNSTPQYLPVQDLVDVYTGGSYISVSAENVISVNYSALKSQLIGEAGNVFDQKGAGAAAAKAAIDEFKSSSFVIQCTIPGMS